MSYSKFSPEVRATVLEALRQNPSIYSAAATAGIGYPCLMSWLQKGQAGIDGYAEFLDEVEAARSMMKDEIVQSLFEIATDRLHPQAVRAARELLTALYPREFSTVKHVIQHKAVEAEMDLSTISTDELRQLRKTLIKVQAGSGDGKPRALPAAASVIEVVGGNGARNV